jgi:hypothetical protein
LLLEELWERGDPSFVDELRQFTDADQLAKFALRWYADQRSNSRQFLLDYLSRPLNAFRHEPLVKRLFKAAEKAGDDQLMARFLVLFDRSIRRMIRKKRHFESVRVEDESAAKDLVNRWTREGYEFARMGERWNRFQVSGIWSEDKIQAPRDTTMPRGEASRYRNPRTGEKLSIPGLAGILQTLVDRSGRGAPELLAPLSEKQQTKLQKLRLFSVHTRHYLRRRTWRYFRRLGKKNPERYIRAVSEALKLYEDQDVAGGLELIDNWGLVHILFHFSPALEAKPHGWTTVEGHTLAELEPAPIYAQLWQAQPAALIGLLKEARCRPVRQWAIHMIRRDPANILAGLPVDELLALLAHEDAEVVALAAETLRQSPNLESLSAERWLALLETPNPAALEILCELIGQYMKPDRVTLEQAVRLASSRPLPIARLGFTWLQSKRPETEADCQALLALLEAEAESLRPELARWARSQLSGSPHFQVDWLLEYLDSRHADVREEGWAWLQLEPRARDDVTMWRRLLESPYDDVRLKLVAALETRVTKRGLLLPANGNIDPELVRTLWATVLLNIHRGGKTKPVVVEQLIRRVQQQPPEASVLLPIVSVALRSVRGPEFRAGLAGILQMIENKPELEAAVRQAFPELKL